MIRFGTRVGVGIAALLLSALVGVSPARAEEPDPRDVSCSTHCHGAETASHRESIHASVLGCVDCHGGDPTAHRDRARSHSLDAGWRGVPSRADIPALCGTCHGDPVRMRPFGLQTGQLAQYGTSAHGRALYERGVEDVAVCTDCHGTHDVLRADDPRARSAPQHQPEVCGQCHADAAHMERAGLPSDSVARYVEGVHGRAVLEGAMRGAPSCTDCHGSHAAAPPGVAELADVCGRCHQATLEAYRLSPHHRESEDMTCQACHDEEEPRFVRGGCTTCHDSHAIRAPGPWMLEGDEPGRCAHCHQDAGDIDAVIAALRDGRATLEGGMVDTRAALRRAKEKGFYFEHEDQYLRESVQALVEVGPLSHGLDAQAIARHLEDGLRRQNRTRERIQEKDVVLRDRKIVLGGLAILLLLVLGLLAVKLHGVRRLS